MNFSWDCGAASILEAKSTATISALRPTPRRKCWAVLVYLLKTKPTSRPSLSSIRINAWGRESWEIFSTALKQMKPDVKVVAELFPKFGAPDFSTEVSRLMALRPDVVLTTSWGGDLDTLGAAGRPARAVAAIELRAAIGESSIQRLGKDLPRRADCRRARRPLVPAPGNEE